MTQLDDLARLIHAHHFEFVNEDGLQAGLHRLFTQHRLNAVREVRIGDGQRIDFTVQNTDGATVGVEVKVGGAVSEVRRQLARYAACGEVAGLLLVTTRSLHRQLDHTTSHGIPVRVVQPAWI